MANTLGWWNRGRQDKQSSRHSGVTSWLLSSVFLETGMIHAKAIAIAQVMVISPQTSVWKFSLSDIGEIKILCSNFFTATSLHFLRGRWGEGAYMENKGKTSNDEYRRDENTQGWFAWKWELKGICAIFVAVQRSIFLGLERDDTAVCTFDQNHFSIPFEFGDSWLWVSWHISPHLRWRALFSQSRWKEIQREGTGWKDLNVGNSVEVGWVKEQKSQRKKALVARARFSFWAILCLITKQAHLWDMSAIRSSLAVLIWFITQQKFALWKSNRQTFGS